VFTGCWICAGIRSGSGKDCDSRQKLTTKADCKVPGKRTAELGVACRAGSCRALLELLERL
jgi:hypothetical protein